MQILQTWKAPAERSFVPALGQAVTDLLNCSDSFLEKIMDKVQNISDGYMGNSASVARLASLGASQ